MARGLGQSQNNYNRGLDIVKSQYNATINAEITNPMVKEKADKYVQDINRQMSNIGTVDFSIQDNISSANRIFDPISKDADIMQDVGKTKQINNEIQTAISFRDSKDKQDLYSDTNLRHVLLSKEKLRDAQLGQIGQVEVNRYTPYFDYKKEALKNISDAKVEFKVDTTTGIVQYTTKGGPAAYKPYEQFIQEFAGVQAYDQMRIEADVKFSDAAKAEASARGLKLQEAENSLAIETVQEYATTVQNSLKNSQRESIALQNQIDDVSKGGDKMSATDREHLNSLLAAKDIKDSEYKIKNKMLIEINSGLSDPNGASKLSVLGKNLFYKLYADNTTKSMAQAYANATYERTFKPDEVYFKQANLEIDRLKAQADMLKAQNEKSKAAKEVPGEAQPIYKGVGEFAAEQQIGYSALIDNRVDLNNKDLQLRKNLADSYYSKFGLTNMYSKLTDVSNGDSGTRTIGTIPTLGGDNQLLSSLSKATGIGEEEIKGYTINALRDKLDSNVNAYLSRAKDDTTDPALVDYAQRKVILDASKAELNGIIGTVTRGFNMAEVKVDPIFKEIVGSNALNSDGTIISEAQFIEKAIKKGLITNTNSPLTSYSSAMSGVNVTGQSGPGNTSNVGKYKAIYNKAIEPIASTLNSLTNNKLKNDNFKYGTYTHTNDSKDDADLSDKMSLEIRDIATKNPSMLFGTIPLNKEENRPIIAGLQSIPNNAIAGVEATNFGSANYYTVRFTSEGLSKHFQDLGIKKTDLEDNAMFNELVTTGLRVKNVNLRSAPTTQTRDFTDTLLDDGHVINVDMSSPKRKFLYTISKQANLDGVPEIKVNATMTGIKTDSSGNIIWGEQGPQEAVQTTSNTLGGEINISRDALAQYLANNKLLLAYASSVEVLENKDKIKTIADLKALAANKYKRSF